MELNNILEYEDYTFDELSIYVYKNYLSKESSKKLFKTIFDNGKWSHSHVTEKGQWSRRRNKIIYGDDDFCSYTIKYRDEYIESPVHSWGELPELKQIRDLISQTTNQEYQTAIVQLYNNGHVGINPHRDKEVCRNSIIASLSLGTTRIMAFSRKGYQTCEISLPEGTLCLINPSTNNYWLHSILEESSITRMRISIVFRNSDNLSKKEVT